MLNHQRELTLPRLTAAPTATSCAYVLTLQFLWRQDGYRQRNSRSSGKTSRCPTPSPLPVCTHTQADMHPQFARKTIQFCRLLWFALFSPPSRILLLVLRANWGRRPCAARRPAAQARLLRLFCVLKKTVLRATPRLHCRAPLPRPTAALAPQRHHCRSHCHLALRILTRHTLSQARLSPAVTPVITADEWANVEKSPAFGSRASHRAGQHGKACGQGEAWADAAQPPSSRFHTIDD